MYNKLVKKGKGNKGFTLIELIVVIAIIGILALILVPRFAGFTEDARVGNDNAACEILERSFLTLIANETFVVPSNLTVEITSDGVWSYGTGGLEDRAGNSIDIADVETKIELLSGDIEVQATVRHTNGFEISIVTDGTVECTVS